MSDGEDTEEMSYNEDEEDYKYEEASEEEEMGTGDDDVFEAENKDDDLNLIELGPRKLRKLERQVSYQVHPVHNILANQKFVISEISETLGIPNHDAALLLRNYKWDKETACDAWWSEQTSLRIKIGLPATVVENLLTVSYTEPCILCHRNPSSLSLKKAGTLIETKQPGSGPIPSSESASTPLPAINTIMGTRAVNRDMKALFKQKIFEIELPDDDNIFEIDIIIKCGGDWTGITHKFRAKIPLNYPFAFPSIKCLESEKSFHPNIQPSDGSICIGLLTSEQWKAMNSLSDVCAALSSMFLAPNWEHSLNQEVFKLFHDSKDNYHSRLKALGAVSSTTGDVEKSGESEKNEEVGLKQEKVLEGKPPAQKKKDGKNQSKQRLNCTTKSISSSSSSSSTFSSSLCILGVTAIHIDSRAVSPARGGAGTDTNGVGIRSEEGKGISTEVAAAIEKSTSSSSSSSSSSADEHVYVGTVEDTVAMVCGHHLCGDCWKCLIQESVDSGASCLHRLCPAVGCTLVIPEEFVERFCGDSLGKYRNFLLESFVAQNKAANYCPAPGCSRIVEYQKRDKTRIITCDCGAMWCWGCKSDPHAPISCKLIEMWDADRDRLMSASMSEVWLAVNVKTCPTCKKRIWKDGGCMHVTCKTNEGGCGTEFCWLCLEKWSTHGERSGGFYACNNYLKDAAEGKLKGEAKSAFEAEVISLACKKEVERYQWHYERHKFMEQSRKLAEARGVAVCTARCGEIAATASSSAPSGSGRASCQHGLLLKHQMAIEKALRPVLSHPPSQHQVAAVTALSEANAALVTCRDVLRWIYVAKYFFAADGPLEIFQSNHDAFESHTEKLNRMIEKDWSRIAESAIKGKYKIPTAPSQYNYIAQPPPAHGGIQDCGTKIDLSPSELYDQLRLLRDMTNETLRFMTAMCQAREFEEYFGF